VIGAVTAEKLMTEDAAAAECAMLVTCTKPCPITHLRNALAMMGQLLLLVGAILHKKHKVSVQKTQIINAVSFIWHLGVAGLYQYKPQCASCQRWQ
jgi:hypothetical protein